MVLLAACAARRRPRAVSAAPAFGADVPLGYFGQPDQPFGHGGDAVFDALAASGGLYAQCECVGTDARARGVGRFADQAVCETVDCPFRLPQGADLEYPHYRLADYVYGFTGCVYAGLADCAGSVCARYV